MSQIADVIKYEGDNTTFIWKHPCEDFNTTTQLIVHETQEAILFLNGMALDLFSAGRYTLDSENIPLLSKLMHIPTNGKTPFHCEVYFINLTEQMSLRWGTDTKVQYIEPIYNFPLSVGASGEMALSVADSRRLLLRLVGTESSLNREQIVQYFRAFLMTKIKTYIAQEIKRNAINIFEIDEKLEEFSSQLKERLIPDFLGYGIHLQHFFVTTIVKPDGEPRYEKFKDLYFRQYADIAEANLQQKVSIIEQQTKAKQMIIESQALAQKRAQEGYTYHQERGFDVAETAAQNEGVGEYSNLGIGVGVMAGVAGNIGGAVSNAIGGVFSGTRETQAQEPNNVIFCENCGEKNVGDAQFCEACGEKLTTNETCKKCGYKFTRSGKFCPKCGTKREVKNDE